MSDDENGDLPDRLRAYFALESEDGWREAARRRVWRRVERSLEHGGGVRGGRGRSYRMIARGMAAAILLAATATIVAAATGILDLGKQTNSGSPNTNFPLSGFHTTNVRLVSHSFPEFLVIGTEADAYSAVERWAIVKALEQFGSFTKISPGASSATASFVVGLSGPVATFDWHAAKYRSKFIVFVHKDLLDANLRPLQKLSRTEESLYRRYVRPRSSPSPNDADHVLAAVLNGQSNGRQFPLVLIGGYVQTSSQVLLTGDFATVSTATANANPPPTTLSFGSIQSALEHGQDPPYSHVVEDVGAEANIITALICHADYDRPTSVCGRNVIKQILRHVK